MKKECPMCHVDLEYWWQLDSFPARPSCDWWLCPSCYSFFSDYFLMGKTMEMVEAEVEDE
ncbi:MAG: hypothetical protein ACW99G_04850 [Candidatus Thorarchaeota archaeon]|jgi:hypothetical protein